MYSGDSQRPDSFEIKYPFETAEEMKQAVIQY
jgi:hypothetical protein